MKRLLIFILLLLPTVVFGGQGTDSLEMSAEGGTTAWVVSAGDPVDAVNSVAGEYMISDAEDEVHEFLAANMGILPGGATIDSVVVFTRAHKEGFNAAKMTTSIIVAETTTEGTEQTLTDSYVTWSKSFPDVPGGSGWTSNQVNALIIEIEYTDEGLLTEVWCTALWAIVHYTTPDADTRRRIILLSE